MNRDFEKRSKSAIEVLSVLVDTDPQVIFLGGSAIQAILKKPRRLSIDVDVSYHLAIEKLIRGLEAAGYVVNPRRSKSSEFVLYTLVKAGVMVKLDVSRFAVKEKEAFEIRGFKVLVPTRSYFLASKLSALSFGAIGRLEKEPIQIIKDIFDINCLLDTGADLVGMRGCWLQIVSDQNRLRGTNYSESECAKKTQEALLRCVDATPLPEFFIPQSALGSFQEFLIDGRILRQDLSTMAARALLLLVIMGPGFNGLDERVLAESKDLEKLAKAEATLVAKGLLSSAQADAIKKIAPKALIYLGYWNENMLV